MSFAVDVAVRGIDEGWAKDVVQRKSNEYPREGNRGPPLDNLASTTAAAGPGRLSRSADKDDVGVLWATVDHGLDVERGAGA
jgi:hypothetical protein